ncbi:uncharacterized protein J5M81_000923 [Pluvialis apricaria]
MDWLPHQTAAFLFLLSVLLDFSRGFHVEVKEWDENGMARWKTFRRQKREWIKFAAACREGEDNSKRNPIAKIRSDCEEKHPITYSISGVGIDRAPYGIFVVNPRTGEINITSIVDREVTPVFVIRCFAKHSVTGVDLEPPLELRVRVLDINDNPPIFAQTVFTGSIEESSMDNTLVMKIIATDADEPNHLNSKIAFKIESQEPSGPPMFIMNKYTGELHLANYLDREQHSSYTLVVKASDRDGAADGISSLCSCNVKVIDVNDNFPTLAQSSFSASISENSLSSELLRIQALDADEEFTDNWLAEFFFISGNEDNCFEIVTDRATNQGILRVIKELNYEYIQTHSLIIGVRNVAAFHHSVAHDYRISGTPLTIEVKNVIEPPRFQPSSVVFSVSESTRVNYIVGTYTAIDEDTGAIASNVVYSIGRDPGAWFRINSNTGEITLNKVINRESIYVINGQYKAEVLAITRGVPRYTATGTIVLSIQDMNYNCPTINTELRKVCMHSPSVIITAKGMDGDSYAFPFTFSIHGEPQTTWIIRSINASSAELVSQSIDFYLYRIYVSVRDNQGRYCPKPHIIPVQACQCDSRNYCTSGATKIIIIGGGGGGGNGDKGDKDGGDIDKSGPTSREPEPEDYTDGQVYTSGYSDGGDGYITATDDGYGTGGGGRTFLSSTTLSGAAIGLMFLGGLIFVLIPILMSMSDCCGCGPGAAGGVGTGFEPVPECTEGAIHPWGIEGAQPEDRVSTSHVSKNGSSSYLQKRLHLTRSMKAVVELCHLLKEAWHCQQLPGGGVVASGVEETTGVGYGTGTGYGTAGGISGTGEAKGSIGGTIKEYREGGVNMAFLDNYFSEKAFVYADEDEGRPANDCLLIYDHEGVGTPVGSVGCCSFIGEDTDETYLDTLGPKFKTLAEICLGKEIEPFPDVNPTWPCVNIPFPNPESDLNLPPPGTTIIVNGCAPMPPPVGTTTVVTENTYTSGSTIQPPRPMPDPLLHGNMTVTETYTSGSPSLCVDPLRASNVVVTERVVGPASASDLRGMLDIPDLTDGSNVIVTERLIAPNSRLPTSLSIPDLVDGSNVVVTERVFRPASGMPGSLINIPSELSNAHNVVVTERVVSGSGMSSLGGTSLGGTNLGGLSSAGQMLSADCHLGQAMGTASPGTSRRRVTKYSTVQYSNHTHTPLETAAMSRGPAEAVRLLALLICLNYGNGLHVKVYNRNGRSGVLSHPNSLVRQKREWTVPPAFIREEEDNSYKNPIARIHSDLEDTGVVVTYTISGQGVTEPPYGLFVINGKTGDLNVTGIVDREKTPMLLLRGHALDKTGAKLEEPIDLPIKIVDINDNFPVFSHEFFVGSIEELSETGTIVMRINATDADEPNNLNSKIAFRIISQSPGAAFTMNKDTGEVRVAKIHLDRETQSSYSLVVEAKDRGGELGGNAETCSVEIKILDVNDNLPVVESRSFEGSIEENRANVEILRIKVFDRDEEFSDNWLANFTFVSGNEGNFFRIVTDTQTNEGILTLVKELDYEKMQSLNLGIVVTNKAEFHKSIKHSYKAQTIPIKINVINVREGPVFPGGTKIIEASEKLQIKQVIGQYQAYDEDTGKVAERITYMKGRDTAGWITIDSVTGEIRLAKNLDYESSYVVNGTYTITMLGVTTDFPKKTVTGTVVIQVRDENDNCPVIVNPVQTVCSDAKLVYVTANDLDDYPNSDPFSFTVIDEPEGTAKQWMIASRNGTSIQLVPQNLKLGRTEVRILIKDYQGFSCAEAQSLQLTVCKCADDGICRDKVIGNKSVSLGPGAIALIILAFLLLLLLPLLLLLCPCGSGGKGFAVIQDYSEAMLRQWNSEGAAPEEKALLSIIQSTAVENSRGAISGAATAAGICGMSGEETAAGGVSSASRVGECHNTVTKERWEEQRHLLSRVEYGAAAAGVAGGMAGVEGKTVVAGGGVAVGAAGAMNEEFLRDYFNDKAVSFADEDEAQAANDCLLVYSQGESGSPHGSIGCCSFIEADLDDHFLDDLGDKFKTLAEICIGRQINMKDSSSRNESGSGLNDTKSRFLDQQNASSSEQAFASGSHLQPTPPVHAGGGGTVEDTVSEEVVTETTFASRSGQHNTRPLPTAHAETNFTMTETSYSAGTPAHSATVFLDPQFKENIVVTERVLAPTSSLQGMVEIPDLPHGSNVVVTERVVKSEGTRAGAVMVQDLPDSQYVVVRERERVLVPAAEQGSLSVPASAEGHNVVVNERVVTASGMQSRAEQAAGASSGRQEHVLITDSLLNQAGSNLEGLPPASTTLSKSSRVTKYSTVQYTRS